MKPRPIVPALAALLVLSAVTGFAAPTPDTTAESLDPAPARSYTATPTDAGGSGSGSSTATGGHEPTAANYTRLYIDAERPSLRLKPGESDAYTVEVENGDDEPVSLDPHVYRPPTGGPVVEADWVTIDGPERLAPGEEGEFTVRVSVPGDAEIGRYSGQVAFTDETVTYPGRPPRPVHAEYLRLEVWREPTVEVHSRSYVNGQVEAGETLTRELVVENTGDDPVPVSPELAGERRVCRGDCGSQFERSWLDVDAPSQIDPGETATIAVSIAPPADADRGRYRAELDLGLKDPNRAERDTYWQRVDLNVEVWRQPDEPFETAFDVSPRTDDVTVTLTPRSGPRRGAEPADADRPRFDVTYVSPNGSAVAAERVRVTDRGFVDLSGEERRHPMDGEFAVRDGGTEYVYRLEDPAPGEWTLRVMPENAIGFSYEVTRNEAG